MLYRSDITIQRQVNPLDMEMPSEERAESEDGLLDNIHYFQICDVSLNDAIETINQEAIILKRLAAIPPDVQEEGLSEIEDELREDCSSLMALDFGVTGLVETLTAIGCVTISSCNGGVMGDHHEISYPSIIFHAPNEVLGVLLKAAEVENAGLINSHAGMLEIYCDDIWKFNRIALLISTSYQDLPPR